MTHRIGRIAAIPQQIVEAFIAGDGLVLPERGQQIGKLMLGDSELLDGFGERDKNRMRRARLARKAQPAIHGAQFFFPALQQRQRKPGVAKGRCSRLGRNQLATEKFS